jgi:hypothetical protein
MFGIGRGSMNHMMIEERWQCLAFTVRSIVGWLQPTKQRLERFLLRRVDAGSGCCDQIRKAPLDRMGEGRIARVKIQAARRHDSRIAFRFLAREMKRQRRAGSGMDLRRRVRRFASRRFVPATDRRAERHGPACCKYFTFKSVERVATYLADRFDCHHCAALPRLAQGRKPALKRLDAPR